VLDVFVVLEARVPGVLVLGARAPGVLEPGARVFGGLTVSYGPVPDFGPALVSVVVPTGRVDFDVVADVSLRYTNLLPLLP
jgi:hypothetical protein